MLHACEAKLNTTVNPAIAATYLHSFIITPYLGSPSQIPKRENGNRRRATLRGHVHRDGLRPVQIRPRSAHHGELDRQPDADVAGHQHRAVPVPGGREPAGRPRDDARARRNRENEERGWRDVRGESTLADMYDYVCHGKIYRFEDGVEGQTLRAYISFGGLLMMLEGPYAKLTPLRVDNTYLLVKK
ncbi:hypothetical protein CIB48_g11615 [Xylaria polymorpha]|nr:hypothetical protein CIB48_g11615 [Xylaria polymorpha]